VLQEDIMTAVEQGADPASPVAQALLRRQNEMLLKYKVRERNERMRQWNEGATRKWLEIGVKIGRLQDGERSARVGEFWPLVIRASPWGHALRDEMLKVRELMRVVTDPADGNLDAIVERVSEICAEHSLSDPITLIGWRRFTLPIYAPFTTVGDNFETEWDFVERAIRVRRGEDA
jgi:hypothetical protein